MTTLGQAMAAQAASTDDDLEAQARPLPEGPGLDVAIEKIPTPPPELVDELDNAGEDAAPEPALEVATLDFCGSELPYRDFPLKYPFTWEGERVGTVTVRQLTTQQMGEIVREAGRRKREPALYDIYAVMCGLPAKVLRALPAVDGEPITDAAFDFLPPLLRPGSG